MAARDECRILPLKYRPGIILIKNENAMEYLEFKPSAALCAYVDCFWVHCGVLPVNQVYRCVPSGNTDIIIGTSDGEEWLQRQDSWERVPKAFLNGMWTEPAVLKSDARIDWFGIRFKPEIFVQMFRQPMREMENVTLDIRSALGKGTDEWIDRIASAPDVFRRIELAEAFLGRKISESKLENAYITEAIRLIRQYGGQVSTEELSRKVFVGERQLQRAFREQFGITPKTYSRLIRFNWAASLLKNPARINWAEVTYTCGYADQAHFIRDFREFAGASPTAIVTDPTALVAGSRPA